MSRARRESRQPTCSVHGGRAHLRQRDAYPSKPDRPARVPEGLRHDRAERHRLRREARARPAPRFSLTSFHQRGAAPARSGTARRPCSLGGRSTGKEAPDHHPNMRESPKLFVIRLMGHVRGALLDSGKELVEASRLDAPEDVFFLRFTELSSDADWHDTVRTRRRAYEHEQHRRQIPRVLTSEGEAFYESGPAVSDEDNVLVGAPVSPGIAEGRVHVLLRPEGRRSRLATYSSARGRIPPGRRYFLSPALS